MVTMTCGDVKPSVSSCLISSMFLYRADSCEDPELMKWINAITLVIISLPVRHATSTLYYTDP